jgi:hypothetical protein
MSGVPATASLMTSIVAVLGFPVVLEGAVITCADGYAAVAPITGVTPNLL